MQCSFADLTADLDWLIHSPPLVTTLPPLLVSPQGALPQPLQMPSVIEQPIKDSQPLGRYYEWLWLQLLAAQPVEFISNLTVSSQNRTIGEFDLLYRSDHEQAPIHRELAVKFYLQAPNTDGTEAADWIGPNPKDRLDLKLAKLLGKQIQLGHNAIARERLNTLDWQQPKAEALIQGRLFLHWQTKPVLPTPLNPNAPEGIWLYHGELENFNASHPGYNWHFLPRSSWLARRGTPVDPRSLCNQRLKRVCQFRLTRKDEPVTYLMLAPEHWGEQVKEHLANQTPISWIELAGLYTGGD